MDYSVCIVLHNSKPELTTLLDSIDACPGPRPQIICADSGSSDGGGDFALERGAELVSMEGNVGFGAANNAALELAIHPVSILLNPDCRVSGDNLARLAVTAAAQRSLVAPRLLNADGTLQESAHPVPGGLDGYLAAVTVPRLLGPRFGTHLQPFRSTEPTTVGWAIGACIAARTELLTALGPFNPAVPTKIIDTLAMACKLDRHKYLPLAQAVFNTLTGNYSLSGAYWVDPLKIGVQGGNEDFYGELLTRLYKAL